MKTLVISDLHIPQHHERAIDLVCLILDRTSPDEVIIAGDALEVYGLSSFDKDPTSPVLEEELEEWVGIARMLIGAGPAHTKWGFIPGNHENRFVRWAMNHPEVWGIKGLSLELLMDLDVLGIEYHPVEYEIVPGLLVAKHGSKVSQHSAYSAKGELLKEGHAISTITGHTHRMGAHYVTTRSGVRRAYENGCLRTQDAEYGTSFNWQLGCSMVHRKSVDFRVEQLLFEQNGGKLSTVVMGQWLEV